jgi:hypothetical protein
LWFASQTPLRQSVALVQARLLSSPQLLSAGSQRPAAHSVAPAEAVQVPVGTGCPLGVLVVQVPLPAPPLLHHSVELQFASTLHFEPQVPVRYVSQMRPVWTLPLRGSEQSLLLVHWPQVPVGPQKGEAEVAQAREVPAPKSPSQATQVSNDPPATAEQTGVVPLQAAAWLAVHCTHLY